jgi:hypothetical protein
LQELSFASPCVLFPFSYSPALALTAHGIIGVAVVVVVDEGEAALDIELADAAVAAEAVADLVLAHIAATGGEKGREGKGREGRGRGRGVRTTSRACTSLLWR